MGFRSESDFLHVIAATPWDDTPRLVFADWLEEHGDDRAEFIRTQCALENPDLAEDRRELLQQRELDLLRANYARWSAALGLAVEDVQFRRGLPERVRLTGWDETSLKQALIERRLASVSELDISDLGIGDQELQLFAVGQPLPALRKLFIQNNKITSDGVIAMAAAKPFPLLDTVYLFGNEISSAGLQAFSPSVFPHLETIDNGELEINFSMSSGQTDARRREYVRTQLLPIVMEYFGLCPRLQSATFMVGRFSGCSIRQDIRAFLFASDLPEPLQVWSSQSVIAAADGASPVAGPINEWNHVFTNDPDPPNLPETRSIAWGASELAAWEANGEAIPCWGAFTDPGDGFDAFHQNEFWPAVQFQRHGEYRFMPMLNKQIYDGLAPEDAFL